jgi:inner membrane protein
LPKPARLRSKSSLKCRRSRGHLQSGSISPSTQRRAATCRATGVRCPWEQRNKLRPGGMASAITHFIVGAALALPALECPVVRNVMPPWAVLVSTGMLAVAPDLDTFIMQASGVPYDSFWGHRGFFHSPFFLLLFAASLAMIATQGHPRSAAVGVALMWAGGAITHPLMDAMTDGGLGVMLLLPFSEARLFFSWRPIHVSPISIVRFFDNAGYILWSELPFCIAALVLGLSGLLMRMRLAARD